MIYYTLIDESAYSERKNIRAAEHSAAMALLGYAVKKEYGLDSLPVIYKGKRGKPYFKDSGIFFNISHAEGIAVCILSKDEAGIDCERDNRYSAGAAKKVFSPEECKALEELPEAEKPYFFTKIWTAKEAYGKATGEGILSGLSDVTLMGKTKHESYFLESFDIKAGEKNYIVTAAARELSDISEKPVKIIL